MNDMGVSLHAHDGLENFFEAAKQAKELRINPKYLNPDMGWPDRDDSPVLGIKRTIPAFVSDVIDQTLDLPRESVEFKGTLSEFGKEARDRLMSHLREYWDASRPTLFACSSGYDSRILSSCLAALRDDGFDLGELHIRCRPPEQESFLAVMKRQGWAPEQYSVYEMPTVDPLDVGCWDRPGVSPWLPVTSQINFWRDIVPYEEEKNWNLFGGSGGGEAVEYPSIGKPPTVPWKFCENKPVQRWFSYFPDGTDFAADVESRFAKVLFPYFGARYIGAIAQLPDRFLGFTPSGCDNIRAAILSTFKDSTLDIPRLPRTYSWSISPKRWSDMQTRYAKSAFLREVSGAPSAKQLLSAMMENFFTSNSHAERIWRLASLWEAVLAA